MSSERVVMFISIIASLDCGIDGAFRGFDSQRLLALLCSNSWRTRHCSRSHITRHAGEHMLMVRRNRVDLIDIHAVERQV